MQVIDLGCGTGELTAKLAEALPDATVRGIDASAEMLAQVNPYESERVHFIQRRIETQIAAPEKWDLVFSHAALQWLDDHDQLIPRVIGTLKTGGQLVVQVPAQRHNIANRLLSDLVCEVPYRTLFSKIARPSPVLETEAYARILFENGGWNITVFEKIYPLVAENVDAVYRFIAGTALRPYEEVLDEGQREAFRTAFKVRLETAFRRERPVFYPFKRIIMSALF